MTDNDIFINIIYYLMSEINKQINKQYNNAIISWWVCFIKKDKKSKVHGLCELDIAIVLSMSYEHRHNSPDHS